MNKSLASICFCFLLSIQCYGQRFNKSLEATKIKDLPTKDLTSLLSSFPYDILPVEIQKKISLVEYQKAQDSISILTNLSEFNELNLIVKEFQFTSVSKLFKEEHLKYRFSETRSTFIISSKNKVAYYNIVPYLSAEGCEVVKTKNGATITQNQEFFSLYSDLNSEWFHIELKSDMLQTIFGRPIAKEIFDNYYKKFFKKSPSPWTKDDKIIFMEVYEESRNQGIYSKVDFDDFCDCRIRELEKISEDIFISDSFWETEKAIEMSKRCFLVTEEEESSENE